jgi:hypothetical protein
MSQSEGVASIVKATFNCTGSSKNIVTSKRPYSAQHCISQDWSYRADCRGRNNCFFLVSFNRAFSLLNYTNLNKSIISREICGIKVKLALCLINFNNTTHRHMGGGGGLGNFPPFVTAALDGADWSPSGSGCFTPEERAPGTHWIGG